MAKKPKTRETANAIYYEVPGDNTAIINAIVSAGQNVTNSLLKQFQETQTMKQIFAQLDPVQQQQLYESWGEKERKRYGVTPRKKTAAEEADDARRIEEAARAPLLTEQSRITNANLKQQLAAGEIELKRATQLQAIIDNPQSDLWDKAFAQGLRGDDAERFVLKEKYPDMADDLLIRRNAAGKRLTDMKTGEYYAELAKQYAGSNPRTVLAMSHALARAVSEGDTSELDELVKDKNLPKNLVDFAYARFKLDVDQLQEARATRLSSDRQTEASLSVRLMELFDQGIGPEAARATANALLTGKETPTWVRPKLEAAMGLAREAKSAQSANLALTVAEKMQGIPEIRSAIETLRQLQNAELGGDNEAQIEGLKKEMLTRISKVYGVEEAELADKESVWSRAFNGAIGMVSATAQTGAALAGDAIAGGGDAVMDAIMQDDGIPNVAAGRPVAPGFGQSSLMDVLPDMPRTATPVGAGGRPIAPPATNGRKEALRAKALALVQEHASAPPERKARIRELLALIRQDPDGQAALRETR